MNKQKFLTIFLCLILSILTVRVYFTAGVPYTHDGENHLARFANYRAALREGQLPPRFAPNLENGYGYPVFNYNYPLANILSIPLSLAGFSYEITFKLIVSTFLAIGSVALWLWLEMYTTRLLSRLLGLVCWLSAPFLLSTLLFRGSIGELIVYGLLPLLLYSAAQIVRFSRLKLWYIVTWSCFFLAHNVSVLWVTPLVFSYFLIEWWSSKREIKTLLLMAKLLLIAITTTLWFWLPALTEMSATVLDGAQNARGYRDHFPTIGQLLSSPLQFGYSYVGSVDSLSFALGCVAWAAILVYPIVYAYGIKQKNNLSISPWTLTWAWVVSICLLFLQLRISFVIWQVLPFFRFIQFPWRLSLFIPVVSALLVSRISETLHPKHQKIVFLALCLYWLQSTSLQPLEFLNKSDIQYDTFTLNTTTQNENRAKYFSYTDISNNPRQPFVLNGAGTVDSLQWTGSYRLYNVTVTEKSTIVEPTMNFPGWETTVNQIPIDYTDSAQIGGRIAYELAPGQYSIVSRFTQKTPARRVGNAISLVSLVWLVTVNWQQWMRRRVQ